jgi:hypothetical protein
MFWTLFTSHVNPLLRTCRSLCQLLQIALPGTQSLCVYYNSYASVTAATSLAHITHCTFHPPTSPAMFLRAWALASSCANVHFVLVAAGGEWVELLELHHAALPTSKHARLRGIADTHRSCSGCPALPSLPVPQCSTIFLGISTPTHTASIGAFRQAAP